MERLNTSYTCVNFDMGKSQAQIMEKYGRKLRAASGKIAANWTEAKGRMVTGYNDTPFNAQRKSNYQAGIAAAQAPVVDVEKAVRNYEAKMF